MKRSEHDITLANIDDGDTRWWQFVHHTYNTLYVFFLLRLIRFFQCQSPINRSNSCVCVCVFALDSDGKRIVKQKVKKIDGKIDEKSEKKRTKHVLFHIFLTINRQFGVPALFYDFNLIQSIKKNNQEIPFLDHLASAFCSEKTFLRCPLHLSRIVPRERNKCWWEWHHNIHTIPT